MILGTEFSCFDISLVIVTSLNMNTVTNGSACNTNQLRLN